MPTYPTGPFFHRLPCIMAHLPKYAFDGPIRLAHDAGLSSSTIYQLLHGQRIPTYRVAIAITEAISRALGKELHTNELFSFTGTFKTASVCELCDCSGCLPEAAYNDDGSRKPEYAHLKGGDWPIPFHIEPGMEVHA